MCVLCNADEASPKTPQAASTSPTRKAAGDATSTLLNFLKQEQANVTDSLTKPVIGTQQQQQQQLSSSRPGSSEGVTASQPTSA
jgi:hypothetical protein